METVKLTKSLHLSCSTLVEINHTEMMHHHMDGTVHRFDLYLYEHKDFEKWYPKTWIDAILDRWLPKWVIQKEWVPIEYEKICVSTVFPGIKDPEKIDPNYIRITRIGD